MTDSEFATALQSLGSQLATGQIESDAYYSELTRILYERFRPSRVNIWRLDRPRAHQERLLECVAEHSRTPATHQRDVLEEAEFLPYLDVLTRHGFYVSGDTLADAALAPMRESYLRPADVLALMDAALAVNGVVIGVVCCEEIGRTREWRQLEITALIRSVATVNVHLARLQEAEERKGTLSI